MGKRDTTKNDILSKYTQKEVLYSIILHVKITHSILSFNELALLRATALHCDVLVVFSACGGIRTGITIPVLTAYLPLLA